MDYLYMSECKNVVQVAERHVHELTRMWVSIFPEDMCRENLQKLAKHASNFFEELLVESREKKAYIEKEIDELKEEAETLKRLLKVDVQLPKYTGDVPLLTVQADMDKSLADLRDCLRERREQICELLLEQDVLCDELGEPPLQLLADPLPTNEELNAFRDHLNVLREEKVIRINQLSKMRRDIKSFLKILDLKVNTETDDRLLNHREIKLNKETFAGLKRLYDCFGEQVEELTSKIDETRGKLESLWNRLDTSPRTRNKFSHLTEYNQKTYDAIYAELQRCELIKKQNIKQYVEQIRQEISQWWDKCMVSDVQKARFSHFNSSCYTDDLLTMHELELEDLKSFYEANQQIFELYADRKSLWERMCALEAKASDPNRYNNRGGQLLREEKERKTIATKLPKIEQQIVDLVREFESREHQPFLINGENIIDTMADDWEKKRQEKEMLMTARKRGQTPLSKTGQRSGMATPLSVKNASMASMRRVPSRNNLSVKPASTTQKRKLAPSEKTTPMAKRSLMPALNSPSLFLRPNRGLSKSPTKASLKNHKVLGCIVARRRSGQRAVNNKNKIRLSTSLTAQKKTNSSQATPGHVIPRITVNSYSETITETADSEDAYNHFQERIKPDSRSSIVQNELSSMLSSDSSARRQMRKQRIVDKENAHLARLPVPRIPRTPSKQNIMSYPGHSSPNITSSGRKLTTRNLPIII